MYLPKSFEIVDADELMDFISRWNFGDLITSKEGVINISQLPFWIDKDEGRIHGHLARQDPQCSLLQDNDDLVVFFKGPNAYISPKWYSDKNMVPTWNFQSVQVRGEVQLLEQVELLNVLNRLSKQHESKFENAWELTSMSSKTLGALMKQIVGFSVSVKEIVGKYKLSQNRSIENQCGVISGLEDIGTDMELNIAEQMKRNIKINHAQ